MKMPALIVVAAVGLAVCGCGGTGTAPPAKPLFRFSGAEAFYQDRFRDAPEPNVVVAGTVEEGTVRIGDDVVVRYKGGEDIVRVLAILGEDRPLEEASKGQGADLRLKVTSEDQYRRWSTAYEIVGKPAANGEEVGESAGPDRRWWVAIGVAAVVGLAVVAAVLLRRTKPKIEG